MTRRQDGEYWGSLPRSVLERTDINSSAKIVACALSSFPPAECWPAAAKVADMTGLSEKSVLNYFRLLEAKGVVPVDRRPGRTHRFVIPWRTPAKGFRGTPATGSRGDENPTPAKGFRGPRQRASGDPGKGLPTSKKHKEKGRSRKKIGQRDLLSGDRYDIDADLATLGAAATVAREFLDQLRGGRKTGTLTESQVRRAIAKMRELKNAEALAYGLAAAIDKPDFDWSGRAERAVNYALAAAQSWKPGKPTRSSGGRAYGHAPARADQVYSADVDALFNEEETR